MMSINESVVARYVKKEQIPVNPKRVNEFLDFHPHYPSMAAFQDMFTELNIENMGVKLDVNDLGEVDFPIMVHIDEGDGRFALLEEMSEGGVTYFDEGVVVKENLKTFTNKWSGMALLLGKGPNSGQELSFLELIQLNKTAIIGAVMILLGLLSALMHFSSGSTNLMPWTTLFLTSTAGFWLSYSLFNIEQGESSNLDDRLCGQGEKVNCAQVVGSGEGKLFDFISWSELGMFFFSGQLICTFFMGGSMSEPHVWNLLGLLNLLAIPMLFYSLYLQRFVLKKWCTLCLIVQALLVINISVLLSSGFPNFSSGLDWAALYSVALSFSIPAIGLAFTLSLVGKAKRFENTKKSLEAFKADSYLFSAAMTNSAAMPALNNYTVAQVGSPAQKSKVVLVINPNCGPCKGAYLQLKKLREQNPDSMEIECILADPYVENTQGAELTLHYLTLKAAADEEVVLRALDSLFEQSHKDDNYQSWMKSNPIPNLIDEELLAQKITEHNQWLGKARISNTPTVYVHGKKLPSVYNVSDLKYHI